uniref:Alpha-L-glutamate ligase-related protein ATP-grasp domain-containing protein n=1 Tax=Eutreptiella gymnastica TaxID=73025 RepID=A0A7S1NAH1_9EUGL|mmetsp:Transcript_146254/g.255409  ORF Transcript_146254/g.255409 Transcript_146254/m.255409 type:complete len:459 (+) Transcript_146254:58-1434(+)
MSFNQLPKELIRKNSGVKIEQPSRGFAGMLADTLEYYRCLAYYWTGGSFRKCPYFAGRLQAQCQVYSVAITLGYLWAKPHYRATSLQHDMCINFRNVAIPGTGVPLNLVVWCRAGAILFMLVLYPIVVLAAALKQALRRKVGLKNKIDLDVASSLYCEQLVTPQDWFSYWRLNSFLAGMHATETQAKGFKQEDKWTFLEDGDAAGVPISPYLKVPAIVVKDRYEEGGMGLFFFKNATEGGKWIIQERIENSKFVKSLLPPNAPLSTFRVMTASRGGLTPKDPRLGCEATAEGFKQVPKGHVSAISCVFRAGRRNANTDHDSILYDVDKETGEIKQGTRNMHWYQLGLWKIFTCPWTSNEVFADHPDGGKHGCPARIPVKGKVVPNIKEILHTSCLSHYLLLPDVPLVGWDVAVTDSGVCMLEVNLSCNFFKGSFNQEEYFKFMADYFLYLDDFRLRAK